jgi:DNA-binding Lrp family transcriptional regulator
MDRNNQPDTLDWKILKELQKDGNLTNVELAGRIGLSPPPTLRRVQALEQEGYITGYRARLDRRKLGYEVEMFALVGLKSQAQEEIAAFERRVQGWPVVRECHFVQGTADFVLVCVARDLASLQSFVAGALAKAPNVDSVKTSLVMNTVKDEPLVPLP